MTAQNAKPLIHHEKWEQRDELEYITGLGTFSTKKRALSSDRRRELQAKYRRVLILRPAETLGDIDRPECLAFSHTLR